jgi:hypothetical protein
MLLWHVNNGTRYSAATTLAADRDGHDMWITVVKATFHIGPGGELRPAAEQAPVIYEPVFSGDPTRSSLLSESDIDFAKPGVDVLVQGAAHVPAGKPAVREALVGLEVAGRRKVLRVHGERRWTRRAASIMPSQANLFRCVPIVYERAFGGRDPGDDENYDVATPAGCGYARESRRLVDLAAPQVVYADEPDGQRTFRPAGFGPLARHWMPRRRFAGTYDERWRNERLPLLPLDFDEAFFMAAPADQQYAQLPNGALIQVVGMSPDGTLSFHLPRLALGLNVRIGVRELHRHPRLRTVLIRPDSRTVVLSFADALPCTGFKYRISATEVLEKQILQ